LCSSTFLAIVRGMGEGGKKSERNRDRFRRWPEDVESRFPLISYPEGSKITVKQVAYLSAYCKKSPEEIARRYPRHLSLGQVHLALAHYHLVEKAAIDGELANEFRLNRRDALLDNSLSLPPVGLASSPLE
jgi:uncharacterized protein (DUF433 family)